MQVNTETVKQYDVPHDGRMAVDIPSYRPPCGVYLFNAIKVGGDGDPLKTWIVSITRNGKTVRKQSSRATQKSPQDEAGYQVGENREIDEAEAALSAQCLAAGGKLHQAVDGITQH